MRSMFVHLQMATDARHLQLVTDLDESIDKVRFPLGIHYFIHSHELIRSLVKLPGRQLATTLEILGTTIMLTPM